MSLTLENKPTEKKNVSEIFINCALNKCQKEAQNKKIKKCKNQLVYSQRENKLKEKSVRIKKEKK